jgi:hypothetical protein
MPVDLAAAVERAGTLASRSGELRPLINHSVRAVVSDELADFVERILTDGTYAGEVTRIGEHDPDLASL